MRRKDVILIDDGVNSDVYGLGPLTVDLEVTAEHEVAERTRGGSARPSHGSTCAAVVRRYAPDAPLGSIKVMDTGRRGSVGQLARALQWCLDNGAALINMSVGSTCYGDFRLLFPLIARLARAGCIVVAAHSNDGKTTLPAVLSCAVGVRTAPSYTGERWGRDPLGRADLLVSSRHELVTAEGLSVQTPCSNSYGAPLVTALAYRFLASRDVEQIGSVTEAFRRELGLDPPKSAVPDFVDEALVIGRPASPVLPSAFGFNVTAELCYEGLEEAGLPTGCCNLVVYPPRSDQEETALALFLRRNGGKIAGLLYAGRLTGALDRLCREELCCLLWEENNLAVRLPRRAGRVGAFSNRPVIGILAPEEEQLFWLSALRRKFTAEGYRCLTAADMPYAYLYGMYLYGCFQQNDALFRWWEEQESADLLLVGSKTGDWFSPDLWLIAGDGEEDREKPFIDPGDRREEAVNWLYEKIRRHFEET